jgi:cation:H+ antiporter
VALALLLAAPAVILGASGARLGPLLDSALFGAGLLGAGFLLSWGAEAAEEQVSRGLALAGLALVTVLPEYAVDLYYTLQAGRLPGSEYAQYAAANMTGANRLLIGVAWPLIALIYWRRAGRGAVLLRPENRVEVAFLGLAGVYAFAIVLKGRIDLWDTGALGAIFAAYLVRLSRLPRGAGGDDDDDEEEVGPAAALAALPPRRQWTATAALTVGAAAIILLVAAPFAEALVGAGAALGVSRFLLIQWVAPLAGEAPEIIITILFTLALRPTAALGALVSDKINQWTLLVGMIPLIYSLGAGGLGALPLDARQREEFFLTAAQTLFAVALLLTLRLDLRGAAALLGLFAAQLALGFVFRADEPAAITALTAMAWLYLALAAALCVTRRAALAGYITAGLLDRPPRAASESVGPTTVLDRES